MTNLGSILGRLGLGEYHDVLVEEGFDTWDTVLDIQESDLTALKFKLGHRRKLQREIANYRGLSCDRSIGSPALDTVSETGKPTESPSTPTDIPERGTYGTSETKRKYRRHPKPDENAPVRPPSAYVIFSNKIREDVRGHNMSFTDIAKLVGDRWQKLAPAEKEPYETQATKAKEKYNAELTEYKKTDLYRDYLRYLAEFKAKHGGSVTDNKRPRLENKSSNGSLSAKSSEAASETTPVPTKHAGVGSVGTIGSTIPQGELGSSIPLAPYAGKGVSTRLPPVSSSTDSRVLTPAHELRQSMALSSHSSVSDESTTVRDHPDPLPHATQLSLQPGPSPTSAEFMRMSATTRRPVYSRTSLGGHPPGPESNSRSPASSRSNVSPSEGSFVLANPGLSLEESWPVQPCEAVRATFPTSASMPISAVALPPLVSSERLPEVTQDQSQRILPLPTTSASLEGYHRLRPVLGISAMVAPRPQDLSGFGMGFRISVENKASLGRSESEAADALAGLAYGSRPHQLPARAGSERRR